MQLELLHPFWRSSDWILIANSNCHTGGGVGPSIGVMGEDINFHFSLILFHQKCLIPRINRGISPGHYVKDDKWTGNYASNVKPRPEWKPWCSMENSYLCMILWTELSIWMDRFWVDLIKWDSWLISLAFLALISFKLITFSLIGELTGSDSC